MVAVVVAVTPVVSVVTIESVPLEDWSVGVGNKQVKSGCPTKPSVGVIIHPNEGVMSGDELPPWQKDSVDSPTIKILREMGESMIPKHL